MKKNAIYELEVRCSDPGCAQMNLHLSIASFNERDEQTSIDYTDVAPLLADTAYRLRTAKPAASVSVSLYAVPSDPPVSDRVADHPDLLLTFDIRENDRQIDSRQIRVNRWGGVQLIGLRYP